MKLPGGFGQSGNRILVGYDLGNEYTRISYLAPGGEVETVSSITGEEVFSIPTVLCKREGANQWFYGNEALRYAREEGGILVDRLFERALSKEPVRIEGNNYEPDSLLALFIKRTLGLLSQCSGCDRYEAVLFTTEGLDYAQMDLLKEIVSSIRLQADKIYFQSHIESFFHYIIRQPGELWYHGCLLLEYRGQEMISCVMESNFRTQPVVVYISEHTEPFGNASQYSRSNQSNPEYEREQLNQAFVNLTREICSQNSVTGIFLTGEQFGDNWMREALKDLCKDYRIFMGNNLYSKGAVYGLLDRMDKNRADQNYVFLGNDKLSSNVGMKILRQGDEVYFALLNAGDNWYEATKEFDFYMQEDNRLEFVITSMITGERQGIDMVLDGFSGDLSRMHASLFFAREKVLTIEVEELGFGAFRSATHRIWHEEIDLT